MPLPIYSIGNIDTWKYNPSLNLMQINSASISNAIYNVYSLSQIGATYSYSSNKSYQIITHVKELYNVNASFSVSPAWNDMMNYSNGATSSNPVGVTQSFIHYSSPNSLFPSNEHATWYANGTFSINRGIHDFKINELDFKMIGFSYYKLQYQELLPVATNSLGWYYDKSSDKYFWYDMVSGSPSTTPNLNYGYYPVGGNIKTPNIGYRLNNCLYKFIPYNHYNLSFTYSNTGNFPLYIYSSPYAPSTLPSSWNELLSGIYTPPVGSILLATLTQSQGTYSTAEYSISENFYGAIGNQYLMFVGGFAGISSSSATYSAISIQNLMISGGYNSENNRQYLMSNHATYSTTIYGLTGATYTAFVGTGNTINATASLENPGIGIINSKIGNGTFKAGIWENGIWNNGWRVDENMYEFHDVYLYFNYKQNKRWRLQITGPSSSISMFNIGDNVSISNIIAIDINEERKLLKGYYTIINKSSDSLIMEFDNNFPLRRIEKDSKYHRIYITKNIWLSGGFLNGYFKGIWNYGLFKGYPLITEMYNTHWIDGVFDGGHFYSETYTIPDFVDTIFQSGKVGLTFSSPHGLAIGDTITINKSNKTINPQYDGDHIITEIANPYQIVTNIDWGYDSINEGGSIIINMNKGLLQKVNFKSNNISKITSAQSLESNSVFLYNSWLDLIYDDTSASNIGKPQNQLNTLSKKTYSENNLYGWITNDVLESNSLFRDSYSTTVKNYRLGTKYKIFNDFIGDAGEFEDEFGGYSVTSGVTDQSGNEKSFLKYGWTFSRYDTSSLTFSRTTEMTGNSDIYGEELRIQALLTGGILDIVPIPEVEIANRTEEEISKLRYSMIEFDLITYSTNLNYPGYLGQIPYLYKYPTNPNYSTYIYVPNIHFNNLNITNRDTISGNQIVPIQMQATYLPIYENVNHLLTKNRRKVEYFYNKRNLSMCFLGLGPILNYTVEYIIDNLHFYEVDMIPFFQYFTEDNINKGIEIPYQAISPFIDYTNPGFNFIDKIYVGLDSINVISSYALLSGVGISVTENNTDTNNNLGNIIYIPSDI